MKTFGSRGKIGTFVLLTAIALAGCGGGGDDGGTDGCAESGAYTNGVCDLGCPNPDPECAGGGDPCVYPNRYGDGTCDLDCDNPDPDCEGGGGTDPCAEPNRYGDGSCDLECWSHDPDCDVPPPGTIELWSPGAWLASEQPACGPALEFGVQVNPSEAVTVVTVEVDASPLGGGNVALVPQGGGYWTGAFTVPNTVPSGGYDLTVTAQGTDANALGGPVTASTSVHFDLVQPAGLLVDYVEGVSTLGGVATDVLLQAQVTASCATVASVTVDLSALGGAPDEPLYDDGTHGDLGAGDGLFVTTWQVPGTAPNGVYTLPVTASGLVDGTLPVTATSALSIRVHGRLHLEEAALVPGTVTWTALADTMPARFITAGVEQELTVRAAAWTDFGATLSAVTVDLAAFGGASDAPMYDDGPISLGGHEPEGAAAGDGVFHATFTVPASQPPGDYHPTIVATAVDPAGDLSETRDAVVLVHDSGYTVLAETGVPLQSIVGMGSQLPMSSQRGVYGFPDGYRFPFYGADYGALTFYATGFARMGNVLAYTQPYEGDARSYALMGLAPMIAVCQSHDLSVTDYEVWYEEQGTAPDRRFVFEWVSTLGFTGSIDAQLILEEATGAITIHYGIMDDTAAASLYPYRWSMLLVNGLTEFDQVYGWAEAPPLDVNVMSNRRWTFTPR